MRMKSAEMKKTTNTIVKSRFANAISTIPFLHKIRSGEASTSAENVSMNASEDKFQKSSEPDFAHICIADTSLQKSDSEFDPIANANSALRKCEPEFDPITLIEVVIGSISICPETVIYLTCSPTFFAGVSPDVFHARAIHTGNVLCHRSLYNHRMKRLSSHLIFSLPLSLPLSLPIE